MKWFFYSVLFATGYVLMLPRFLWRMARRGGYGPHFLQRFGVYGPDVLRELWKGSRIWVHAVSVGEMGVGLDFVKRFRAVDDTARFVISTTTSTGYAEAQKRKHKDDLVVYFPVDLPPIIRRVLLLLAPRALVLVEGELWPNLIRMAGERRTPVFLINGRMTESSLRGYRLLKRFFGEALGGMRLLMVQTERDADRFEEVGARREAIRVVGNVKYDGAVADGVNAAAVWAVLAELGLGGEDAGPVVVGGSTWPGEERWLVEACARLRETNPGLRLVLVPRHAERSGEVERTLREAGVPFARRSKGTPNESPSEPPWVLLVDTTGELRNFYAVADVVFVGKSLFAHGGQNMIEPAALGKPVVVGPHTENFEAVMGDLLAADAIRQAPDPAGLEETLREWLADPAEARAVGTRAERLVAARRGVLDRSVDLVRVHMR